MASTRTLRIKVRTDELIAKIEAHKLKLTAEYEKALAEYEPKVSAWAGQAALHVDDAAGRLLDGDLTGMSSRWEYVDGNYRTGVFIVTPRLNEIPSKPSKPDTRRMDRDLSVLRVAAEDTITLSADDNLASYL